ncbi:hypothetical protein IG631_01829 [Alternaria alternata]|nr:hypothetical protein IG631_01829 [Alternaria alternata]
MPDAVGPALAVKNATQSKFMSWMLADHGHRCDFGSSGGAGSFYCLPQEIWDEEEGSRKRGSLE